MDIKGTTSKIVATCAGDSPCTASIGNVCSVASASLSLDGVVCRLPECPAIVEGSNWNVWSASCAMITSGDTFHNVALGKTVKIKKSAAMVGELVIDRGSDTSGNFNRHFHVQGSLEMEDVTLTGGYVGSGVSSFCSLSSL